MEIKIIDLLNKIANGEEVPKKIRDGIHDLELCKCNNSYHYAGDTATLLNDVIGMERLNDYVEIIEEPKKIEYEQIEELTCNDYDFEKKTINSLIRNQKKIIDEVNKLKEGK